MDDLASPGYLLLGYFVVLVALSMLKAVHVRSPAIQRLRAFFPSWKFFEDTGDVPSLHVRAGASEDELGAWEPCLPQPRRRWSALVLNAEGNLLLAYGTLLQQLVAEVHELGDAGAGRLEASVSYQLVHQLVRQRLAEAGRRHAGLRYQFSVRLAPPGAIPGPDDDLVVSSVHVA